MPLALAPPMTFPALRGTISWKPTATMSGPSLPAAPLAAPVPAPSAVPSAALGQSPGSASEPSQSDSRSPGGGFFPATLKVAAWWVGNDR